MGRDSVTLVADVLCSGCGHPWPKPFNTLGKYRITRCTQCPPEEPISAKSPPDLHTQLEDLHNAVLGCEKRERLQDRLDQLRD